MTPPPVSILFLLFIFLSCHSSPEHNKKNQLPALPKTKNTITWEQNGTAHKSNTLFGKMESSKIFSFYAQSVLHEKLSFNEIPFQVGVYHIGGSLDEKGDDLVGASFTIDKNEKTVVRQEGQTIEANYCYYLPILERDKDKNYMALTYVDAARRIVQGKFKVRFKKQEGEQCKAENAGEIEFAEGAFAVQLPTE